MATTNPVSQLLVTSGNQAPLAAGSPVSSLKHGQIGVFNYHTGQSVDSTSNVADLKDVFIAVGINRTTLNPGDSMEDMVKSAGQILQTERIRAYTFKGYVPPVQKVVEITGLKALADTPYGIKIEFRNQKSYSINGYNQFSKTFDYVTAPSLDPLSSVGNNGDLAKGLINDINADDDQLVTAAGFAYQIQATIGAAATAAGNLTVTLGTEVYIVAILSGDTVAVVAAKIVAAVNANAASAYSGSAVGALMSFYPGVSVATGATAATIALTAAGGTGVTFTGIVAANATIANLDTFRASNPNTGIGIRITGVAEVRPSTNADVNIQYHKTGTDFIVSLPYGFEGIGSVNVVTTLQYEEGSGYDIKQQEYEDGGLNGKPGPYRLSPSTGLSRSGFEYFTNPVAKYHQFVLAYDQKAVAGWQAYEHNLETVIAVPKTESTTFNGLVTILDAIFTKLRPLAGAVAANDTEQVPTNTLGITVNGIQSLS